MLSNPRIADAAVVGIPDVDAGEIAKAFVVKKDESLTKQEVHDFVAGNIYTSTRLRTSCHITEQTTVLTEQIDSRLN